MLKAVDNTQNPVDNLKYIISYQHTQPKKENRAPIGTRQSLFFQKLLFSREHANILNLDTMRSPGLS